MRAFIRDMTWNDRNNECENVHENCIESAL